MFKYLRKRRALRSYKTTLATKLRKRYGRERHYTPEQVQRAAIDSRVSDAFLCYAYAMFCEREAFDAHHRERGESCDYDAMRSEIGTLALGGSIDGSTIDATSFEGSGDAGDAIGSFDGGGFDGGCD